MSRKVNDKNKYSFKPTLTKTHCTVYRWLLNEGYTIAYLSTIFNREMKYLSGLFRNPRKITVHEIGLILLLLKDSKYSQSDILSSLLRDSVKIDPEVEDIYRAIKLPETNEQVYRTNFDPKEHNLRH